MFHLVPSCTALYCLVQPCTVLVQSGTRLYILVRTAEIWIMSVHTSMYQKAEFGTEIGTSRYIPVPTVLYRCTGFQMENQFEVTRKALWGCFQELVKNLNLKTLALLHPIRVSESASESLARANLNRLQALKHFPLSESGPDSESYPPDIKIYISVRV